MKEIGAAIFQDVEIFNSGERLAQNQVASAICEEFGSKGDLIECEKVVINWHKDLNSKQRDPFTYDHEEAKQLLIHIADHSINFGEKIYSKIPLDYHHFQ